jgi:uncharacterized OB-fold protein
VVYSHTVVWRPQLPSYEAPYVIAVVELAEGWHLFTNVVGCEPGAVHIGMQVRAEFVRMSDEITLPFFVPDDTEQEGSG